MTKESTAYEQLVQEVYQALVNQDAVTNIDVQHDVVLTGKSGATHQIDVYWEFKLGGEVYRTIIECRRYRSNIKKDQVAALKGIRDDLAPGTTAIMVTTEGYQSGALAYAQAHGVRLIKVNPLLQTIVFNMDFQHVETRDEQLVFDEEHARSVLEAAGLKSFRLQIRGKGNEIVLVDANGNAMTTLHDLLNTKAYDSPGQHVIQRSDLYMPTEIGLIKLAEVRFEAVHHHQRVEYVIDGVNVAKTIIEDVLENRKQYLHPDGTISNRSE